MADFVMVCFLSRCQKFKDKCFRMYIHILILGIITSSSVGFPFDVLSEQEMSSWEVSLNLAYFESSSLCNSHNIELNITVDGLFLK